MVRLTTMHDGEAEEIALAAFGFIAGDPVLVDRFCGMTGLSPGALRKAAAEPGFLGAVLDFVVGHEPDLLAFSAAATIAPERIARAQSCLAPE